MSELRKFQYFVNNNWYDPIGGKYFNSENTDGFVDGEIVAIVVDGLAGGVPSDDVQLWVHRLVPNLLLLEVLGVHDNLIRALLRGPGELEGVADLQVEVALLHPEEAPEHPRWFLLGRELRPA